MCEAMIGPSFPEPVGCNLGVVAEALFALTKCRFRLLAVFYICQNLVPPHDLAPLVPQWHGASQEPAIFPICPAAKARLDLDRLAARQRGAPRAHVCIKIVRMDGSSPP